MKCYTCCPRKEKRGFQGLYAHARERFGSPIMKELHQLLHQVMDNAWAQTKDRLQRCGNPG